ncbi:MAG: VanW family protein [Clostridiales bacterium]|jgi:vancomycin resistance protein YoaR|nr:VanW family protein [Clostridiales bacterium]
MNRLLLACVMLASLAVASADAQIPPKVFVDGVNIGGMTRDDAADLLKSEISIADEDIIVIFADTEIALKFRDFGADYDIGAALDEATESGDDGGFFAKLCRSLSAKFKTHRIDAEFIYDADRVAQIAQKISDDASISAKEPTYAIAHDSFVISEGRIGRKIDTQALALDIAAVLQTREGGKVTAKITEIHPKYTTADFEAACDLLGSFQTPFNPHMPERTTNIAVASAFLDGQVILPGETFSTSTALRPRTTENGYVTAGQIFNGEPDAGIGGGICQISSTLYMAALHAEIAVTQRTNHSLMVGYMEPATDAALAEGYIDLVLENNTKHPILIQSIFENGRYTINIFGHESRQPGRLITFESVLLETRLPDGDKIIEDPFLPAGISQIVSEGIMGAKYELYKIVTENGATQRVKINTSNYQPLQRVVRVGSADLTNQEDLTNAPE